MVSRVDCSVKSKRKRTKSALGTRLTTMNIRSDPMATWECAKQIQASPQLLGKRNTCALHFRELKKTSIETESLASDADR